MLQFIHILNISLGVHTTCGPWVAVKIFESQIKYINKKTLIKLLFVFN